jgi:uncharacterized protein (TIGR00369 family)
MGETVAHTMGDAAAQADTLRVLQEAFGGPGALADRMGIQFLEASPYRVVGTMPVAGNTQPYGLLHGGASCVLAETLGSVGASLHAARTGGISLGVEISASHHRPAREGLVTGTATPLHLGSSVAWYEIVIEDESGKRVCTARLTCLLRPA